MLFGDYQGTRLTEGIDTGEISVPSAAERSGDFDQNPLTGSVSGPCIASLLSARLGRTVTAGEPYATVFPDGKIPQSAWSAPAQALLSYVPQPNAGTTLFATAATAETLSDNKGALRADWTHGKGALAAYYFADKYSLDNPYPTGTGGASVPGFDATSSGLAQLASLAHAVTFGSTALNEFHLSFMRMPTLSANPKAAWAHRSRRRASPGSLPSNLPPKASRTSLSMTSQWVWTQPRSCKRRTFMKSAMRFRASWVNTD
jgi:hypothetical protein